MKRTPLIRKTPLKTKGRFAAMTAPKKTDAGAPIRKAVTIRTAIRRKAQPKPTKAESRRMEQVKSLGCVCCWKNRQGSKYWTVPFAGCDAHHLLSGGVRRGHRFTIGACPWHHRGVPPQDMHQDTATRLFGPSLHHGSKPFHECYGSDDELLELQEQLLAGELAP